jgi:hypothetical protein
MANRAGGVPKHLRKKISLKTRPQHWLAKARQLKKAADILFIEFENDQEEYDREFSENMLSRPMTLAYPDDSITTMLLGFAIENLLKGLYVNAQNNAEPIEDLNQLKLPGRSHALEPIASALAERKLINFSPEEIELLHVLERAIFWRGRYPSPKNIDFISPAHESGQFKKMNFKYPDDHYAAITLYDRLDESLSKS